MYRKGAHRWDIPSVSDGNGGYAGRCIWCGEEREHRPYDEPAEEGSKALTVVAKGICPECGNGYASKVHRAHKQAVPA